MTHYEIIPSLRNLCIQYAQREDGIVALIFDGLLNCLPSIVHLSVGQSYYFVIHPYGFEGSHYLSFLNERLEKVNCRDKRVYEVVRLGPNEVHISLY